MPAKSIEYSVLDLCPIVAGGTAADAFANAVDLARHAEKAGYTRYWIAEHHNIPGVASSATSVVICHVAEHTSKIRVGSGGIMLPNHAALMIAEQFGTLESLFPGRIDLGLGRAPGGDMQTARALRRGLGSSGDTFPSDLLELQAYLKPARPGQAVHAVPGAGTNVPIYLLGSSDFSASLAAELGLPFAFASHFAPDYLAVALATYRSQFTPSEQLEKPYVMVGTNVIAAETDEEARKLFTTMQQIFLGMVRGARGQVPPPVGSMEGLWTRAEEAQVMRMLRVSAVGSVQTIQMGLEKIVAETGADEIIATGMIYDHGARVKSFELAAKAFAGMNRSSATSLTR
jgi:luciferase family oxidoreductase group 1